MKAIIKYFRDHQGYARMKGLKKQGFQTRDVKVLVKAGRIAKIKPGLYRLAQISPTDTTSMVELCLAIPKAVVCLTSALAFLDLTTFVPSRISYALPRADKPIDLNSPTEPFYFSETQYKAGIQEIETKGGTVRVYGPEKSICDSFRFRNKLGEDIALEALKTYLRRRDRDLNKLMRYAEICRAKGIISQYVRAIVG